MNCIFNQVSERRGWLLSLALLFVLPLAIPQGVLAQSAPGAPRQTATITGSVTDANGKPIVGADVHLVGPSPGETTTDPKGLFTFISVSLGTYTVTVNARIYGSASRENIVVGSDTNVDVNYMAESSELKTIARVSTSNHAAINVTPASVAAMSPSNYAFQGVTSWRQILEQIPGVAATGNTYSGGDTNDVIPNGPFQPVTLSINGAQPYETATLVDGMPITNVSFSSSPGTGADLGSIPLNAFDAADIVRGPGADSPSILDSVGGAFMLHAPGAPTQNLFEFSYATDPYGGFSTNAKVALKFGRLSTTVIYGLNDSPGPISSAKISGEGFDALATINGQSFTCPSVGPIPSSWLSYGCLIYRNPPNIQPWYSAWEVTGVVCCDQDSSAWDVHNGSASLNYKIGSNINAEVFYAGDINRALQTGWIYPDIFAALPGYSGSVAPGMYHFLDVITNSPEIEANSMFEEKITANFGRGVLQVAALQNNSYGVQDLGFDNSGTYKAWGEVCLGTASGPTPTAAGSCPPGTTLTVYNGTPITAGTYGSVYGQYHWTSVSNNRDLSLSYNTQIGSATNAGVSFVKSYYNDYSKSGYAAFGYSVTPNDDSETSYETRVHIGSDLTDKLHAELSGYFTDAIYHVPDPAIAQNLSNPCCWKDAKYPYSAPRLGLIWRASENLAIRGAAGAGYALPPLYHLLGTNGTPSCSGSTCSVTLTNINLQPEKSFGFDIGGDIRLNSVTNASLDIYHTDLHGQFFESALANGTFLGLPLYTTQYQNLGHSVMEGINLSFQANPARGIFWKGALGLTRGYLASVPAGFYNLGGAVCSPAASYNCTNTEFVPGINFTGAGYSGISAVPYANGYGSIGYRWTPQKYVQLEADYFGKNNSYYDPPFVALNGYAAYPINKNVTLLAEFQNITCIYCGSYETFTNTPVIVDPAAPGALPYGINGLPYGPRTILLTVNFRR